MNPDYVEFRSGVVSPMECIKEGWALIKDDYWLFFGLTIVSILVGGAFAIILMGPMMIGLFLCMQQRQRNQPVEFGMLFKGFEQFLPGLIVTVLKTIPIIILLIPYYIFIFGMMATHMPRDHASPDDVQAFMASFFGVEIGFFFIIFVVSMLIEIFFMLAYPLIADRKLSGMDAVKLSFRAGKANVGGIVGLILLNALFGMVGLLCCVVGVYLYIPVAFASQAVAYRRIFPDTGQTFPAPPPPPGNWA
ncbi:MAG TPA: hypothetical protein VE961_27035 [Pyrinomonadaceae bacterium]|nr:hypothetical protein [Pyrinomonadaceae bacterium]